MRCEFLCVVLCITLAAAVIPLPDDFYEKNEYRFRNSLKPPFYPVAGNQLPFWRFGGNAGAAEDFIRLTPLTPSQQGWLSNTEPVDCKEWEVIFEFAVGGGGHLGGDGLALWYLPHQVQQGGPALGGPQVFDGLAIAFDSFDNDSRGDNPRVAILRNSNQARYDGDGSNMEVAGCVYSYRNSRESVVARIRYQDQRLTVSLGLRSDTPSLYYECANVEMPNLPLKGHWSITAATGGLTDKHDVVSFTYFDLNPRSSVDPVLQAPPVDPVELGDKELNSIEQANHDLERERRLPPEHHVRKPLAEQFKEVYSKLKGFEFKDHPEHHRFQVELNLPEKGSLKTEKDRLTFVLDTVFAVQKSHDEMIAAFESILHIIDEERATATRMNKVFAEAFTNLYDNVAGKQDVEDALATLGDRRALVQVVDSIHAALEKTLAKMDDGSPLQQLADIGSQIPTTDRALRDLHAENAAALASLQQQVMHLLESSKSSTSLGWMDYLMFAEAFLFALYLWYAWRAARKLNY